MANRVSSASDVYQLFNVRLPPGVVERIQAYVAHLNETQPGIDANASMAARMLLMKALDQVEAETGIGKAPKSGTRDPLRGRKP
jgi:hypothetical protein